MADGIREARQQAVRLAALLHDADDRSSIASCCKKLLQRSLGKCQTISKFTYGWRPLQGKLFPEKKEVLMCLVLGFCKKLYCSHCEQVKNAQQIMESAGAEGLVIQDAMRMMLGRVYSDQVPGNDQESDLYRFLKLERLTSVPSP